MSAGGLHPSPAEVRERHGPQPGTEEAIEAALGAFYRTEGTRQNIARWLAKAPEEERAELARALVRRTSRNGPEESPGWPDVPDLPGPPDPDTLPLDVLPTLVRDHVESVAGASQTPADLAALLSLAAIATAVQGKGEVVIRGGWREPLNIYVCGVLPPASRKSSVYRHVLDPLEAWEREQARREAPDRLAAEDLRDALEKRLERVKREVAKGEKPPEAIEAARFELLEAKVPAVTRLNAPEASPEALVKVMAEQAGRIAVLAPEGDSLRIADGRYSGHGDARLDVLKRAWTGRESIRTDRIGRDGEYIPRPALTLGLCFQPSVLETLRNKRSLRGEGVFGRILWTAPDPDIGSRLTGPDVPPLDEDAARAWDSLLRRLLDSSPKDVDEDGAYVPHMLRLTEDAREVLHAFEAEVEEDLGPGGTLGSIPDWGGKLVGDTVRLAALLQLAARAGEGEWEPLWEPVTAWAMKGAVRLGRALTSHALTVFGAMDMDGRTADLRYLLSRLRELPEGATERELREATRGRKAIDGAEDVAELVDALEERGCVRRVQRESTGPGRPPSPTLELHPSLLDTDTRNTGNTGNPPEGDPEEAENGISGISGMRTEGREATDEPEVPSLLDEGVDQ